MHILVARQCQKWRCNYDRWIDGKKYIEIMTEIKATHLRDWCRRFHRYTRNLMIMICDSWSIHNHTPVSLFLFSSVGQEHRSNNNTRGRKKIWMSVPNTLRICVTYVFGFSFFVVLYAYPGLKLVCWYAFLTSIDARSWSELCVCDCFCFHVTKTLSDFYRHWPYSEIVARWL